MWFFMILLLINIIRKNPKNRTLIGIVVCEALFIVGFLISLGSSDKFINIDSDIQEIILEKTIGNNGFLKEDITLIKEILINIESYKLNKSEFE